MNWMWVGVALVLGALYINTERLKHVIKQRDATIAKQQADLYVQEANIQTLTNAIISQNASIDKMNVLSTQHKKSFALLGTQITSQNKVIEAKLTSIAANPVTCEDTIKYLITSIRSYQ
jgi:hypothetical protein